MMKKIILVDDEIYARQGLLGLIPWHEYGYEIIGQAKDGEEALRMIELQHPDVVITDIRMPVLDGLGLIQAVKQRGGGHPKFIIISGYNDFKYAQQAVRFGVQDFILKPIDEDELTGTLTRLNELFERTAAWPNAGHRRSQSSLIDTLLTGHADDRMIADAAHMLGIPGDRELCYLLMERNDIVYGAEHEAEAVAELAAWKKVVTDTAASNAKGREPFIYDQSASAFGVIVTSEHLNSGADTWERLAECMLRSLSPQGDASMRIYVGKSVMGLEHLKESCSTANKAAAYKYALDEQKVVSHDNAVRTELNYKELNPKLYAALLDGLEEQDMAAVTSIIGQMFDAFERDKFASESVIASVSRCVHGIIGIVQAMQGSESALASLDAVLQWHQEPKTLAGLRRIVTAFVNESSLYIAGLRRDKARGGIQKIKQYIETHYRENISLKSIAKQFFMNPVYLGQLFKKNYGVYFNDFLLELRIGEAKRQLRQTDCKIYEIAANVGFGNPDYFVTQFEKVERKTPTEYKNGLIAKT
jgi:two-component system response regulator YesN